MKRICKNLKCYAYNKIVYIGKYAIANPKIPCGHCGHTLKKVLGK